MVNEVNVNGTIEDLSIKSLNHINGVQVGTPENGNVLKYDAEINAWKASGCGVDYSEEEVDTGVKWIDGKAIYRRVIVLKDLPFGDENRQLPNYNIDNIIKIYGCCVQNSGWIFSINSYQNSDEIRYVAINKQSNILFLSKFPRIETVYLIIEYTKNN